MSDTATMQAKRTALAALIKATLEAATGDVWRVDERFRKASLVSQGSRLDRDKIMGRPIRYVRLAYLGSVAAPDEYMGLDSELETGHQFGVFVWMEYKDADTYAKSSEAAFGDAIEGTAGILPTLRATRRIGTAPNAIGLSSPEDVITADAPLALGDDQYAHYLQFFITAT